MAQQNSSMGMASDLCLGRPSSSSELIADDQLCRTVVFAGLCADGGAVINNTSMESQLAGRELAGLECYVSALQGEREKLDAFRREVPICVELLEHALQDSRMKLAKALASSRSIASLASYRSLHFNHDGNKPDSAYNNAASYVVNFNKQQLAGAGVQNTASKKSTSTSTASDDEAAAAAGQLRMWGGAGPTGSSIEHAHTHTAEYNLISKPEASACAISANPFHDHPRLQLNAVQASNAFHPSLSYNSCRVAAPSRPAAALPQLHLINSYDNRPFRQKEPSTPNHSNASMEPFNASSRDAFHAHNVSSSTNNLDNMHGMFGRDANNYQELVVESMQEHDRSPPTMLASNSQYNNVTSAGGMGSQTPRKARRCWSPELHQRFLHALQQLGGPQLATPKQIREVMHVDGLTNDEVKSHLQKFRLHTRRPAPMQVATAAHHVGEPAQQPHHFVLFGGIWMPSSPAEPSPMAACQVASNGQATSSPPYMQFQHVIGQNPMQALLSATAQEQQQLSVHAPGMESASEVDVARSDQSSQNGEAGCGVDNNSAMHEHDEEDTEIHLGSKPLTVKEITSPSIAKARYQ